VAQNIHISDNHQECKQGEDDEVFHSLGIGVAVVLVFGFSEYERFVGISESLCYHSHNHGNLTCRTIDAELSVGIGAGVYLRKQNLVCRLVQYSGDAEHKDRPAIREHTLQKSFVERVSLAEQLLPEEERKDCRAEEVDIEGISGTYRRIVYLCDEACSFVAVINIRQYKEEHEVQGNSHKDIEHLQGGELDRAFLVSEIGKRYTLECVNCHCYCHDPDV